MCGRRGQRGGAAAGVKTPSVLVPRRCKALTTGWKGMPAKGTFFWTGCMLANTRLRWGRPGQHTRSVGDEGPGGPARGRTRCVCNDRRRGLFGVLQRRAVRRRCRLARSRSSKPSTCRRARRRLSKSVRAVPRAAAPLHHGAPQRALLLLLLLPPPAQRLAHTTLIAAIMACSLGLHVLRVRLQHGFEGRGPLLRALDVLLGFPVEPVLQESHPDRSKAPRRAGWGSDLGSQAKRSCKRLQDSRGLV